MNIHEAIPGHYTQLMYANRSPSLVKSIFYNGAMIEGWAVYAERMMLENGYGHNAAEIWLMEDKTNLRITLNILIDRTIQVDNMSEKGRAGPAAPRRLSGRSRGGQQVAARNHQLGAAQQLLCRLLRHFDPARRAKAAARPRF